MGQVPLISFPSCLPVCSAALGTACCNALPACLTDNTCMPEIKKRKGRSPDPLVQKTRSVNRSLKLILSSLLEARAPMHKSSKMKE